MKYWSLGKSLRGVAWLGREANKEEMAYVNAWSKIKAYIAKEYKGVFVNGLTLEWKHDAYHKIALCVENNGNCFIEKGSHGWAYDDFVDNNDEYSSGFGYLNLNNGTGYLSSITLGMIKEVVKDWVKIKSLLEAKRTAINKVYNFEV